MRNDPEGALPFLRQAADKTPGDPISLYALANGLMALDTPEHRKEADTCLTRALALRPRAHSKSGRTQSPPGLSPA